MGMGETTNASQEDEAVREQRRKTNGSEASAISGASASTGEQRK